jgi:hypothetical protein
MIPFKMKILNYSTNGTYSVEYIPENEKCTPIKLDIRIDVSTTTDPTEVVNILKGSSPQELWNTEIGNSEIDHDALLKLVNTEHSVYTLGATSTGYSTPQTRRILASTLVSQFNNNPTQESAGVTAPGVEGFTPNQQVASRDEQMIIKLKVIIQQVIQEMAEGTV